MKKVNYGLKLGALIIVASLFCMITLVAISQPIPDYIAWLLGLGFVLVVFSSLIAARIKFIVKQQANERIK